MHRALITRSLGVSAREGEGGGTRGRGEHSSIFYRRTLYAIHHPNYTHAAGTTKLLSSIVQRYKIWTFLMGCDTRTNLILNTNSLLTPVKSCDPSSWSFVGQLLETQDG